LEQTLSENIEVVRHVTRRKGVVAHEEVDPTMKQFNVAVVGCGNVARMHFEAYTAHPERIQLVAACDPDHGHLEEARRTYGFTQGFASVEEMIAHAKWDVAVVCTPTPIRAEAVDALAAAGKHVLVEKPFADNYDDARHMVETCDAAGVRLAVNQNFRYHYPFATARDLVAQGTIGRVVNIVHQDLMFRQDAGWRVRTDRHALSVMGSTGWTGSDFCSVTRRHPSSARRASAAIDCAGETDASVYVSFARGAMASYVESFSSPFKRTETVVVGETGVLVLGYDGTRLYDKEHRVEPRQRWDNPYAGARKPEATFRISISS
jgi:predicted dehydrogenase